MIDFTVGEDHRRDARTAPAPPRPGPQLVVGGQLRAQVGRGVEQNPALAVGAHGDGRLGAAAVVVARVGAVGARAVPLRHSTTRRRAENDHAHCTKGPGLSPGPSSAVPAWFRRCRRTRRLPSPARRPRIRVWSTSFEILQKRWGVITRNRLASEPSQTPCQAGPAGTDGATLFLAG